MAEETPAKRKCYHEFPFVSTCYGTSASGEFQSFDVILCKKCSQPFLLSPLPESRLEWDQVLLKK